jgi:hypothetical protein
MEEEVLIKMSVVATEVEQVPVAEVQIKITELQVQIKIFKEKCQWQILIQEREKEVWFLIITNQMLKKTLKTIKFTP